MANQKYVLIFFGSMLIFGLAGLSNAIKAAALTGGNSIDTAVELAPGSYEGGALEEGYTEYFYLTGVKGGQEVNIKGTFNATSADYGAQAVFTLYDENEEIAIDKSEGFYETKNTFTISWLSNNAEPSYKYYLEVGCSWWGISSYSLEVSINDRYDARTQMDAGDDFATAMLLGGGTFKGYLAGEAGSDFEDYYKINMKAGERLGVEVVPIGKVSPQLRVYNSDREVVADESGDDGGAILKATFTAERDDYVYVNVVCDAYWCSEEMMEYSLKITGAELTEAGIGQTGEEEGITRDGNTLFKSRDTKTVLAALCIVGVLGIVVLGIIIYVITQMRKDKQKKDVKKSEGGSDKQGTAQPEGTVQSASSSQPPSPPEQNDKTEKSE